MVAVERARASTAMSWPLIAAALATGCKFPPPPDVADDAASADHSIGGRVEGLWHGSGLVMRLEGDGVDERLTVDASGSFSFSHRLAVAAAYVVSVSGQPAQQSCTVLGGSGTVGNADVADIEVTCVPSFSLDVALSAPVIWTFEPSVTAYNVSASLLAQATAITVTSPTATSIRVNGSPAASGISTLPISLTPGSNSIVVDVAVGTITQRYTIDIDRGESPIVQGLYGKAANADPGDRFGATIAIAGERVAVGAPAEDSAREDTPADNSRPDAGAVYLLRRRGNLWAQEAYVKHPAVGGLTAFGASIALEGDTLVVGYANQVRVFRRDANGWAFAQQVLSDGDEANECYGAQVRLLGDVLVVAAPCEPSSSQGVTTVRDNVGINFGALYVFRWNGAAWIQEAFLKPTGRLNPGEPELGARGLALAPDIVAATFFEDAGPRVQVYRRVGGTWTVDGLLMPADGYQAGDEFGAAVAASSDTIIVGAPAEDSAATGFGGNRLDNSAIDSGAVYVFRRRANGWMDEGYIKAPNTGAGDQFGASLTYAGEILVVAAPAEDGGSPGVDGPMNDAVPDSGAVYAFRRVNDLWMPPGYIKASNPGPGDRFGSALALSLDSLVVGAELEDSNARGLNGSQTSDAAPSSGAVYVFR